MTWICIVWISLPSKVEYLYPLINLARNQGKLVISTLNYDNTIELATEPNNFNCNTGIDYRSKTGNFDTCGDGLHLLKLHGSVDWTEDK